MKKDKGKNRGNVNINLAWDIGDKQSETQSSTRG